MHIDTRLNRETLQSVDVTERLPVACDSVFYGLTDSFLLCKTNKPFKDL